MFGMEKKLEDKKVAIVATDGFEESELLEPKRALEKAGAIVEILSPALGEIRAWKNGEWGKTIEVNRSLKDVSSADYDALFLPGGVINADKLRTDEDAVNFVTAFAVTGKPIAAICHAAWTLIETGYAKGRTMTSWPSLKTDLENAGVHWVDEEVVTDNGWVTSRKASDIPAFNKKMIEEIAEGEHLRSRFQPDRQPTAAP